ncbi:aminotransferase-like domain-containing protein [Leucobacter aridicollis]|uniref:aminotransferase-like domain-containing protein n=1 Tax=Leucobacter aridicollis TaxID=283878 RepID=UPI000E64FA57|nr:PLP-dependent aminotransferase family protein [Leucobacter aridicollis]UTX53923.1 PLP-dependent aminotransferase family protein [Leucobacter aridicollis]
MSKDNRSSAVAAQIRAEIADLSPGDKLPGVRELASRFKASAATISEALAELSALGLVRAEPGRGTFVARREPIREADYSWQTQALGPARVDADRASRLGGYGTPQHVPLSWGYLAPELVPGGELTRITARVAKHSRSWQMTPVAGSPDLRRVIAADYTADPGDVLIVPGGQQGLAYALRTLSEPGGHVITESPSYPGVILAAQSAGLTVSSVPADAHGIRIEALADELERTRARVVYVQPTYANPTGAVLAPERRTALIELAAKHGAFVVEDDWARYINLDEKAPRPVFVDDPNGHVVTVTTLSKPVSPGLRLGAVIARGPAGERLQAARAAEDLCVSPLTQEVTHALLTSQAWVRHRGRLSAELTARRDALVRAIHTYLPDVTLQSIPRGGLHMWGRLPEFARSREVAENAYAAGVLVGDGRHFFVNEPSGQYLRFSFGAATEAQAAEGARLLARVLET